MSTVGMELIPDIHASPPPFEFDFLLSPKPNTKDEMSTDQGSIKIEEVREKEKEQEEGAGGEDVSMTGTSPPSSRLLFMALLSALSDWGISARRVRPSLG